MEMTTVTNDPNLINFAFKAIQLYDETHPRPRQVNMLQAAEMLDVSYNKVRNLVRHGTLKTNKCGLIPIAQIDRALAGRQAA